VLPSFNGGPYGSEALAELVTDVRTKAQLPGRLSECGVVQDQIGNLAEEAATQWTASYNPRKTGTEDFERLYEAAF
jgi:alcohol dehydrogenase